MFNKAQMMIEEQKLNESTETAILPMQCYTPVLDACCGGRQFWFDKKNSLATYQDIREETVTWNDDNGHQKRKLEIKPDIIGDFTQMSFPDETFYLVVFDPPHFATLGKTSRTAKMYGKLFPSWEDDIANGFKECFRVLKPNGTLIFKWNSTEIPLSKVLELAVVKPLFGHTTGRQAKTHWVTFLKNGV